MPASTGTERRACQVPLCAWGGGSLVACRGMASAIAQQATTTTAAAHSTGRAPQPSKAGTKGPSARAAPSEVWYRPMTLPRRSGGASRASSASVAFHSAAAPMPLATEAADHTPRLSPAA